MNKIGVFLGYQPDSNLSVEGIGRLLAFILKEQDSKAIKMNLYCPEWSRDSLTTLLKDNKVSEDNYKIITTNKIPIGVYLKRYLRNKQLNKQKKISKYRLYLNKIKTVGVKVIYKQLVNFLSTASWGSLTLRILFYSILALVSLPFLVIGILNFSIYLVMKFIIKKIISILKRFHIVINLKNKVKGLTNNVQALIFQKVIDEELNRVVTLINSSHDLKVCYIPSMAWPQINKINCKKVVAAPDILFYDFPTQYSDVITAHNKIRITIDSADHLICYSDYVKDNHLIDKCGVQASDVTVIKHANIKMDEHLKMSKTISKYISDVENAKMIVHKYIRENYYNGHVLYNANILQLDYIIYSSQARPHKNIYNLVKAMNIINKEYYSNIKLILTGNTAVLDDVDEYIKKHHLTNTIFIMRELSSEVLAAFNKLAKCAITPTLFEGGFPFTFSEAYSVGTPSIMSDIPVVRSEIHDEELKKDMLFDPYNPQSIADKIIWATNNREYLLEVEKDLYTKFNHRDWKNVVGEYNNVFKKMLA